MAAIPVAKLVALSAFLIHPMLLFALQAQETTGGHRGVHHLVLADVHRHLV
jgi:hypothetical protein